MVEGLKAYGSVIVSPTFDKRVDALTGPAGFMFGFICLSGSSSGGTKIPAKIRNGDCSIRH
jgi:hypothetical protein